MAWCERLDARFCILHRFDALSLKWEMRIELRFGKDGDNGYKGVGGG